MEIGRKALDIKQGFGECYVLPTLVDRDTIPVVTESDEVVSLYINELQDLSEQYDPKVANEDGCGITYMKQHEGIDYRGCRYYGKDGLCHRCDEQRYELNRLADRQLIPNNGKPKGFPPDCQKEFEDRNRKFENS